METILRRNMSVITGIIGRGVATKVIRELLADGVPYVLIGSARGTLIQDKWYQTLLPMISPELEVLQLVVPDPEVDHAMELVVQHGQLQRSGAGAVFCTPCDDLHVKGEFPLWPIDREEHPDEDASATLAENLTAIHFISQGERTDAICRAAMSVGAHGPIVQYSEGRGLRDRLGWLRVTSKPTKEVVTVLVDNVDADLTFAAMAQAGQVDRPGRGLIYSMPVQRALVNIDSVYSETRHSASIQQIIRAIDELKCDRNWRDQSVMTAPGGQAAGLQFLATKPSMENMVVDQARLAIVVDRRHAYEVSNTVINMGAPGVNIHYLQLHRPTEGKEDKQHREFAQLRIITSPSQAIELRDRMLEELKIDAMVFVQPIGKSLAYKAPKEEEQVGKTYRGARVA